MPATISGACAPLGSVSSFHTLVDDVEMVLAKSDLDIFAEIASISMTFAEKHGARIMSELGMTLDPDWQPDISGFKASLGVDDSVETMTYKDIQERRRKVQENLQAQSRRKR